MSQPKKKKSKKLSTSGTAALPSKKRPRGAPLNAGLSVGALVGQALSAVALRYGRRKSAMASPFGTGSSKRNHLYEQLAKHGVLEPEPATLPVNLVPVGALVGQALSTVSLQLQMGQHSATASPFGRGQSKRNHLYDQLAKRGVLEPEPATLPVNLVSVGTLVGQALSAVALQRQMGQQSATASPLGRGMSTRNHLYEQLAKHGVFDPSPANNKKKK